MHIPTAQFMWMKAALLAGHIDRVESGHPRTLERFRHIDGSPDCARQKRRGRSGYAVGCLGMRGNRQAPPQAHILTRFQTHPDSHTRTRQVSSP